MPPDRAASLARHNLIPPPSRRCHCRRHRPHPPGAAPAAGPFGGGERICRPSAEADGRVDRRDDEPPRGRAASPARPRCFADAAGRRVARRRPAAGRDRQGADAQCRLLILDEPTAALGGEETERLFAQIKQLRKEGVGFIYISHRLDEIARIADRVAVLRDGRLVARTNRDVPVHRVVEQMVGRSVDRMFPEIAADHEVLRVRRPHLG